MDETENDKKGDLRSTELRKKGCPALSEVFKISK